MPLKNYNEKSDSEISSGSSVGIATKKNIKMGRNDEFMMFYWIYPGSH